MKPRLHEWSAIHWLLSKSHVDSQSYCNSALKSY